MKKYLFLLLIGAASLTACGDDDDPVVPELNKLTKVSCYKDGASSPLFTADINYTSDGKISNINLGVISYCSFIRMVNSLSRAFIPVRL